MRTILYLGIMLIAIGCSHPDSIKLSESPTEAAKQIELLVPTGTAATTAKQIMERQNFSCSIAKGDFADLKNIDYIYCDRRIGDTVQRRWQVALVLSDGKVSGVKVTFGLIGP